MVVALIKSLSKGWSMMEKDILKLVEEHELELLELEVLGKPTVIDKNTEDAIRNIAIKTAKEAIDDDYCVLVNVKSKDKNDTSIYIINKYGITYIGNIK